MVTEKTTTEESRQLNDYEMVVIFTPELAEESLESAISGVTGFITGRGGVIGEMEQWGKRKLAYPIKHALEGHYILARFQMPPSVGKELEASLQISKDVLRHLLIKKES